MNFMFVSVVVALTGLFGVACVTCGFLHFHRGGKKTAQTTRSGKSSTTTKKTFDPCTFPGCHKNVLGQDPHTQCFTSLTPYHDMNICGPCLTSPSHTQQYRAICFLWNMEPRTVPLPVLPVDKVSPDLCSSWAPLTRHIVGWPIGIWPIWNTASCLSVLSGYFIDSVGFAASGDLFTPGSVPQSPGLVLPTFEESTESTGHQRPPSSISSSVQETSAGSQLPTVLTLATSQQTADPPHLIQSLTSSTIVVSVEDLDVRSQGCDTRLPLRWL